MDFQKIEKKQNKTNKNKAIDTISQIVQPWPARREQPDTALRPGIVLPTYRQPFLLGTMFINSCQSGHSISQIINCITYYPSIPVLEKEALYNQLPGGHDLTKWKKVPRAIKLTKKTQKIHESKPKKKIHEGEWKGKKEQQTTTKTNNNKQQSKWQGKLNPPKLTKNKGKYNKKDNKRSTLTKQTTTKNNNKQFTDKQTKK